MDPTYNTNFVKTKIQHPETSFQYSQTRQYVRPFLYFLLYSAKQTLLQVYSCIGESHLILEINMSTVTSEYQRLINDLIILIIVDEK